jgi:SAM-dependent methyltransferase
VDKSRLLADVARYYSEKLAVHGETPEGVDWNGEAGQVLRFEQLARVIGGTGPFSINDVGCGYGALLEYLRARFDAVEYIGCDVSADMVESARRRHQGIPAARFVTAAEPPEPADYSVASGILNVRQHCAHHEWKEYVDSVVQVLDRSSRRGFAFNCLTSYSDEHRKRADLYYEDPCRMFDLCKRNYSRHVALLHDYGLYEFTIVVRKEP